jgi:hypothetical protein
MLPYAYSSHSRFTSVRSFRFGPELSAWPYDMAYRCDVYLILIIVPEQTPLAPFVASRTLRRPTLRRLTLHGIQYHAVWCIAPGAQALDAGVFGDHGGGWGGGRAPAADRRSPALTRRGLGDPRGLHRGANVGTLVLALLCGRASRHVVLQPCSRRAAAAARVPCAGLGGVEGGVTMAEHIGRPWFRAPTIAQP